jgi:hypothetical protein
LDRSVDSADAAFQIAIASGKLPACSNKDSASDNFCDFCESLNARIAGMAPQSWFVALGRNLLGATTDTDATKKERQAAVEQLRRLTNQLPNSVELRQLLTEAVQKLRSQ